MIKKSTFHAVGISLALCVSAAWASRDSAAGPNSDFAFFPDLCASADVSRFFLQKDGYGGYFKTRYFVETTMDFTYMFVSYKKTVFFQWNTWIQGGMGQTKDNVVFDPMDVSFGLLPMLEFHVPRTLVQIGLDHSCYHEIDRKDFNTTYINKIFLNAGSRNARFHDFWQGVETWPEWVDGRRFSWFALAGWYLKGFPGIDSSLVNYENNRELETDVTCRYAICRFGVWTLYGEGRSLAGYEQYKNDVSTRVAFWRQDLRLLSEFRSNDKGLIVYAQYTRDGLPLQKSREMGDLPRFSKDGLLQVGIRYSN